MGFAADRNTTIRHHERPDLDDRDPHHRIDARHTNAVPDVLQVRRYPAHAGRRHGERAMTLPTWFHKEHAATKARIAAQVEKNLAEDREKTAALKWCRENGNPHLCQDGGGA